MAEKAESRRDRWKPRLREIGNIVLGVLIALALGAVATEIGWRIETRTAKTALADELGEILGQASEREQIEPCLERKLDAIGAILTEADRTGRLPPLGDIGSPPWRTWSHNVWDSTISANIASHFDRETLDNMSGAYEFVAIINHYSIEELDAWRRLFAVVGPGRAIAANEIVALREALSKARMANRMQTASGLRLTQLAEAYELPVNRETVAEHAVADRRRYCSPISHADGRPYGDTIAKGWADRIRANPITRDSIGDARR